MTRSHGWAATLSTLLGLLAGGLPVAAEPPAEGRWERVFADEFDGAALDAAVWQSQAGPSGHILSSRWPENVQVQNGLLRLVTRREARGGQQWTSGNVWTRTARFGYGWFEARYRYGAAPGLNNAFWLMSDLPWQQGGFATGTAEIDINEGHYPAEVNVTLHHHSDGPARRHVGLGKSVVIPDAQLSRDFQVYAAAWTPWEVVFYCDGRELARTPHDFLLPHPMKLLFSSAVVNWAGQVTQALDGTAMEVDWVRVWRRTDPWPAPPAPQPRVTVAAAGRQVWRQTFESAAPGALPAGVVALRGQPAVAAAGPLDVLRRQRNEQIAWSEAGLAEPGAERGQRVLLLAQPDDLVWLPFPTQTGRCAITLDLLPTAAYGPFRIVPTGPGPIQPAEATGGGWGWLKHGGPHVALVDGGWLRSYAAGTWFDLGLPAAGDWQTWRLVCDPAAGQFDLFIGDRLVGGGQFRDPQPKLGGLALLRQPGRHDNWPLACDNVTVTALD